MERIAIIGLGLIGGSVGLALKRAGLKDVRIAGTARTRDTVHARRSSAPSTTSPHRRRSRFATRASSSSPRRSWRRAPCSRRSRPR